MIHKHFFAGVVFNTLEKSYGVGILKHTSVRNHYDIFEHQILFEDIPMKICLLVQRDCRILTVFDKSSEIYSPILILCSALQYSPEKLELQHSHNIAMPPSSFVRKIQEIAKKEGKYEQILSWPTPVNLMRMVA